GDQHPPPGGSHRAGPRAHSRHPGRQPGGAAAGPLRVPGNEAHSVNRTSRRSYTSLAWLGVMYLLTAFALIPLGLVLWFTVAKGLPPALHIEFYTNVFRPVGVPGAGIKQAIVGTLMLVGMASVMAIPAGILGGIYLAEYGLARWAGWVRLASDVLVGTPSIAVGLFVYAILVAPLHHFSGVSGSVALAVLMLPIVVRTTEGSVALIPSGL